MDARVDPADVATELVLRRELGDVLAAFEAGGVRTLVFKGAALGFTHYAVPAARPRIDADLLVRPEDREAASRTLERLGYRQPLRIPGELTRSQAVHEKVDALGVTHIIDLHWKISKPQVFGRVFSFDELAAGAVPLPALGSSARTPGPVHALAIACVHRVAHHHGPERDRPMWIEDIHRLSGRLNASEARAFAELAASKRILRVCAEGLSTSRRELGTSLPAGLLEWLEQEADRHPAEPSAMYLRPRMRRIDVLVSDLSALPTWRARAQLLGEHVFPPASYMQEAYSIRNRAFLPVLYLWRVVQGATEWFHPPRRE